MSMLRRLLAVLLLLGLAPAAAQAQHLGSGNPDEPGNGTIAFSRTAVSQWLPLRRGYSSLIAVDATINGQPVVALIDTAFPVSYVDSGFARANGLPVQRLGGGKQVAQAGIREFRLGPITQHGGGFPTLDMSRYREGSNLPATMVLGADFLGTVAFEIDYARNRIRFRESGATPPAGIAVPITLVQPNNQIFLSLRVGQVTLDRVVLSTGANTMLKVTAENWARLPLAGRRQTSIIAPGPSGDEIWPLARFDGVRLGEVSLNRVEIFSLPGALRGSDADGILGTEALLGYHLFVDASAGRMVLTRRTDGYRPKPPGLLGLQGVTTARGYEIEYVMPNSPAAAVGLKPKDLICIVNGERIDASWIGTPKDDWGSSPVGTRYTLSLCNGRTLTLVTQEFY